MSRTSVEITKKHRHEDRFKHKYRQNPYAFTLLTTKTSVMYKCHRI